MIYLRIGLAILIAAGVAWGVSVVARWRADARALVEVRRDFDEYRRAQAARERIAEGVRNELDNLKKTRANAPARVVRLCAPAARVAGAAGGNPGPGAAAGRVSPSDGPGDRSDAEAPGLEPDDRGPELYGIADDADELAARLRGCQVYASELYRSCTALAR